MKGYSIYVAPVPLVDESSRLQRHWFMYQLHIFNKFWGFKHIKCLKIGRHTQSHLKAIHTYYCAYQHNSTSVSEHKCSFLHSHRLSLHNKRLIRMLRWFHLPRLGRETATQKHSSHGNVDTACHLHDHLPLKHFYNQAIQTCSAVLIFSSAFMPSHDCEHSEIHQNKGKCRLYRYVM